MKRILLIVVLTPFLSMAGALEPIKVTGNLGDKEKILDFAEHICHMQYGGETYYFDREGNKIYHGEIKENKTDTALEITVICAYH